MKVFVNISNEVFVINCNKCNYLLIRMKVFVDSNESIC